MSLKTQIATITAGLTIFASILAPAAFADTSLTVSGNGTASNNQVDANSNSSTNVSQLNNANITNTVNTNANTGGNSANDNTGGGVVVGTGNATSVVDLSTKANMNVATVNNCGCNSGTQDVTISGNGSFSDNAAQLDMQNNTNLAQNNNAQINNNVQTNINTGDNYANRNTGGDTTVFTGNAASGVSISNQANANIANVGGNSGANNGSMTATISGNGTASQNWVDAQNNLNSRITQDNQAWINNNVNTNATTGNNRLNDNTGGSSLLGTGNAQAYTYVSNMANFNAASTDCGCSTGATVKLSGNGSFSDNAVQLNTNHNLSLAQTGTFGANNKVSANPTTGYNSSSRNTGIAYDPVELLTGNGYSDTTTQTMGNTNLYTSGGTMNLPGGYQLSLGFDMGSLLSQFGM